MRCTLAAVVSLLVAQPAALAAPQQILYGHIASLTRKAGGYELKFDPAWWLTGSAAAQAKLEDTGSKDLPNDYYIVEEGHRLLTFVVPSSAQATVLTRQGAKRVTVAELAQIAAGRNPKHRDLLEPKAGFWIRIGSKFPNPVVSLEQQYQP